MVFVTNVHIDNDDDSLDLSDDNIVYIAFFFVVYPQISMRPTCYENEPLPEPFWVIKHPGPRIIGSGQCR